MRISVRILFFASILLLLIPVPNISIQYCIYCPANMTPQQQSAFQQALNEKLRESLKQQIQQSQDQHAQDLQLISLLLAISIGLACGIVALAVVFLKNRPSRSKVAEPTTQNSTPV